MVPSLLFVLYVYGLFAAGAWSGPFEPARAFHAAGKLGVSEIVALLVAALLLGLVLHPFQFSMTQLLEGYWGGSGLGFWLARRRILHYRCAARALGDKAKEASGAWRSAVYDDREARDLLAGETPDERQLAEVLWLDTEPGDQMLPDYLRAVAASEAYRRFPLAGRRVMPTRLGNVLRRYEDSVAGSTGSTFSASPRTSTSSRSRNTGSMWTTAGKGWISGCACACSSSSRRRCRSHC